MAEGKFTVDGIQYHTIYERPDDGPQQDSPCILLIHALMSNAQMWDYTVKALHSAGYATLRYDHIGHHRTRAPQDASARYHMDDLTRHAHTLVQLATGKQHIAAAIGSSIGGVIALRYQMLFPNDVDRIISIASPGITTAEPAPKLWASRIQQFEKDQATGSDSLCYATVERWVPGDAADDERARAEAFRHVETCSLRGYQLLADAISNYDYAGEVGRLNGQKCLIMAGSEDTAAPAKGLEELARKIEGAQFVSMQGVGHLPPLQRPAEFDRVALAFLRA